MTLQQSVHNILLQLEDVLLHLTDQQFAHKSDTLSGASIGQHVRHVVEMFVCMQEGYVAGVVNYEKRKRDITIETSTETAIDLMKYICSSLFIENKDLTLEAGFNENSNELNQLPTNYFREIAYNLEHAIHHMALIKIGFREVSHIQLPEGFGIASSTIRYRTSCTK
jgi:hypothetical protein